MKNFCILLLLSFFTTNQSLSQTSNDLHFTELASRWDEAIPLGNGMLGQLIWQKGNNLRFSLDRADLWDLRPIDELKKFNFKWVCEQVNKKQYDTVQKLGDQPYEKYPAPTKIPGAALEFDISTFGKVKSVRLFIDKALCVVKWESGRTLQTYIHATLPIGWFKFENMDSTIEPILIHPQYATEIKEENSYNSVEPAGLALLGYTQGKIYKKGYSYTYIQQGWNGFEYEVAVKWKRSETGIIGCWSISSNYNKNKIDEAEKAVNNQMNKGFDYAFKSHTNWWKEYWEHSNISIPDKIIEKQWYMDMYKFGSASRKGAPPITLQAVWTADNGSLPPWKGDYHNDLNTQLSYWPSYTGNHLAEEQAFTDWLWSIRKKSNVFTKRYFGTAGLAIPGVSTLTGEEMGGWIQYSLSPTTSAWLAHHFYLHWKYSMDKAFLTDKAYPFLKEVALMLEELTVIENGIRKLPLSSSPEINDNNIDAWFTKTTNYDLSLIKWELSACIEMAEYLNLKDDAKRYKILLSEFPDFSYTKEEGFLIAPDFPLKNSHRHFSHLMSIYPLGLTDISKGINDSVLLINSLKNLEKVGVSGWCGYSYSWLGCLYARSKQGDKAADSLNVFANCYCSPNSFHLNGNQCKKEYRPFTLEGNFAFAAAVMEMLIQSHTGIIEIFPAIPSNWKELSFNNLRAQGAFLISAEIKNGLITKLIVKSEKGGLLRLKIPGREIIEKNTKSGEILNF